MRNKILLISLLVSLAFNIGFVIVFGYTKYNKPNDTRQNRQRGQSRMRHVFKDENVRQIRNENIEYKKAFFTELAKSEVDYTVIDSLRLELEESQKILEHVIIHNFIQLRGEVEDDEAQEIFGAYLKRYERIKDRDREKNNNENRRKR